MSRWWSFLVLCLTCWAVAAQPATLPLPATHNADQVIAALPALAREANRVYTEPDEARALLTRFRLYSLSGDHASASRALQAGVDEFGRLDSWVAIA